MVSEVCFIKCIQQCVILLFGTRTQVTVAVLPVISPLRDIPWCFVYCR